MTRSVHVIPLSRSAADVRRFLKVSYRIYRDEPCWVAPLLIDSMKVLSDANPFFEHAEMQLWIANQDGKDVGRIAGIVDRLHNERHHDHAAYFGFFESIHDPEVSGALFKTVLDWTEQKGLLRVLGPMNPSGNDECGLLVDGFDRPPVFMMPYNPSYYEALVLQAGFRKLKNLLAYFIDLADSPMDRLDRLMNRFRHRQQALTIRPIRRRDLERDLAKVKEVYNQAWEQNWGFVPMTDREISFMAARLKPLFYEGLVWLAETEAEPVGFLLAMPDYNQAIKPLRGRLLTPNLLRFIPYLLHRKIPFMARVIVLGVKPDYRARGIESMMLAEGLKVGFKAGFRAAEASWVLEDNVMSRRVTETFGGKPYKTYRLYAQEIAGHNP
jgi:ribosomal protein S18 acetylase RimI-like enzyme